MRIEFFEVVIGVDFYESGIVTPPHELIGFRVWPGRSLCTTQDGVNKK
jgi:hypothetical protein